MENPLQRLLCSLGICDERSIEVFYPRTADREDVQVLRCRRSGVIFLSGTDHLTGEYYAESKGFSAGSFTDVEASRRFGAADTERRAATFRDLVLDKRWIDVGAGAGAILTALAAGARQVAAVEPQIVARVNLERAGWKVYDALDAVPDAQFDVATLFHVMEHFVDPIRELRKVWAKLAVGGTIVVEVPHANDFMISFLELDDFRRFVFNSEHVILHTRQSLLIFLKEAGFCEALVSGVQRYPLANHLHWLAGKGGRGHLKWAQLRTPELDGAYAAMLGSLDMTDTLLAVARKGKASCGG